MASAIRIRKSSTTARTFDRLKSIVPRTRRAIRETWYGIGDDLEKRAAAEIRRTPKSGRIYIARRSGRRFRHQASAPGETHADLSGALRKSISWKVRGNQELIFGYGVTGSAPKYADFVEQGTSRMAARPSLGNAVTYVQAHTVIRFEAAMSREFLR